MLASQGALALQISDRFLARYQKVECEASLTIRQEPNQPIQGWKKYNTPSVLVYHFTSQGLDELKHLYHELTVPPLLMEALFTRGQLNSRVQYEAPNFFVWNQSGDTYLSTNPVHLPTDELLTSIQNHQTSSLKHRGSGLPLLSWFVHPELKKYLYTSDMPIKIGDLEKNGERYLVSILDLTIEDVPYLRELETMALQQLRDDYGVDSQRDIVRMFFHFPYAFKTATLHMHVRVNPPTHAIDFAKSYSLQDVIEYLESGKGIKQLILDRQADLGGLMVNEVGGARQIMDQVKGGSLTEEPNPFYQSTSSQ
jgi:hypothetical protein